MALIPFAERKLIPPGSSDPRITARIGILHVDAGNAADLFEFFRDRSGGIESHGHIRRDGHLYQYRDTAFQADANNLANDFAISFETQGFGEGEWTAEQIATIKRVMLWARETHGIPLRKVTSWNDPKGGWGYHTLFGAPSPWTPVSKSCPGPDRIKQFHNVLIPWMSNPEEDIMATKAELSDLLDAKLAPIKTKLDNAAADQRARDHRIAERLAEKTKASREAILEAIAEADES